MWVDLKSMLSRRSQTPKKHILYDSTYMELKNRKTDL